MAARSTKCWAGSSGRRRAGSAIAAMVMSQPPLRQGASSSGPVVGSTARRWCREAAFRRPSRGLDFQRLNFRCLDLQRLDFHQSDCQRVDSPALEDAGRAGRATVAEPTQEAAREGASRQRRVAACCGSRCAASGSRDRSGAERSSVGAERCSTVLVPRFPKASAPKPKGARNRIARARANLHLDRPTDPGNCRCRSSRS